jgi:hypothetical protein
MLSRNERCLRVGLLTDLEGSFVSMQQSGEGSSSVQLAEHRRCSKGFVLG